MRGARSFGERNRALTLVPLLPAVSASFRTFRIRPMVSWLLPPVRGIQPLTLSRQPVAGTTRSPDRSHSHSNSAARSTIPTAHGWQPEPAIGRSRYCLWIVDDKFTAPTRAGKRVLTVPNRWEAG